MTFCKSIGRLTMAGMLVTSQSVVAKPSVLNLRADAVPVALHERATTAQASGSENKPSPSETVAQTAVPDHPALTAVRKVRVVYPFPVNP